MVENKIKSTPLQSSPALRTKDEAEAEQGKIKMDPSFRWDDDTGG